MSALTVAKPTGGRAYGSIPHVIGSKRGPADHGLEEGQSRILTEGRNGWTVFYQEKLDGSCMSVAKIDGEIMAIGRAGFPAVSSPYLHLRLFERWVASRRERFEALFAEWHSGVRLVGEWMLLATGMRYWIERPDDLFVAFDLFDGKRRLLPLDLMDRCRAARVQCIETFERIQGILPHFIAEDSPEGWVARAIDRTGQINFLGKWVRPDFEQGKYLAGPSQTPVYNYPPHLLGSDPSPPLDPGL